MIRNNVPEIFSADSLRILLESFPLHANEAAAGNASVSAGRCGLGTAHTYPVAISFRIRGMLDPTFESQGT